MKKTGWNEANVIVILGLIGGVADLFLNHMLETNQPVLFLSWLLPSGAAVGYIVRELNGIRQAIRPPKKQDRSDN